MPKGQLSHPDSSQQEGGKRRNGRHAVGIPLDIPWALSLASYWSELNHMVTFAKETGNYSLLMVSGQRKGECISGES